MIQSKKSIKKAATIHFLPKNAAQLSKDFSTSMVRWLKENLYQKEKNIITYHTDSQMIIYALPDKKSVNINEGYRATAAQAWQVIADSEHQNVLLTGVATDEQLLAAAEGIELAAYRFSKYFSDPKKREKQLKTITLDTKTITPETLNATNHLIEATCFARDLVNEPGSTLTAHLFADRITTEARNAGITVEILNKTKIEALKMGGLLAVNQGSAEEPAFAILEWKPENATNHQPIVWVGKGITFDTGGSNLKTERYMEDMKEDMAGGAAVTAAIIAAAQNQLPIHLIALVPLTDNRIGNHSFLPGDIITMHNGKTVEVGNTDAEGRLILADAISYADHFNPQLIISIATLTGSAQRAIGKYAMVGMGNSEKALRQLKTAGETMAERVVEFPFWDDYKASLHSDIADLNNLGGSEGGAIIAGKFLEQFTSHPFVHLDIAGVAFAQKSEKWKPAGGTGAGVRLLYQFAKMMSENE